MRNTIARLLLAIATGATAQTALAAALPENVLELRCWLRHTRERTVVNLREPTAVEFATLRDGYRVRSPFVVDFAVRGMGVTPAGVKAENTGHHHILVNRDLPKSITAPIPFDDKHKHFGKGQTGTLLDLPPGRHRLRLLFADHEHRPHFVFSREISVDVLGPRSTVPKPRVIASDFDATCQAWYEEEVSAPVPPEQPLRFVNVRDGEPLTSPFNLRFGAEGFGICAAGVANPAEKTGHFLLELSEAGPGGTKRNTQTFDLTSGATQMNVFVPPGDYRLRLRLVDAKRADLAPATEIGLRVVKQEAI